MQGSAKRRHPDLRKRGTIVGSLIGAVIMGALGNGLNLLNVSAFWQRVIMGIVIVVVVVFDQWRRRRFGA